jgi:hypothetical protein
MAKDYLSQGWVRVVVFPAARASVISYSQQIIQQGGEEGEGQEGSSQDNSGCGFLGPEKDIFTRSRLL